MIRFVVFSVVLKRDISLGYRESKEYIDFHVWFWALLITICALNSQSTEFSLTKKYSVHSDRQR